MSRFESWSVLISALLTGVTGVGLLWTKYFMESVDPWAVINHPLQPWLLKAHVLTAPLLVFTLGLISVRHVWQHYRSRFPRGRKSGLLTALVAVPMVLSGYLIQVVTHVGWLRAIALAHIGFGLLFSLGLVFHRVYVHQRATASARMIASRRDPEIFAGRG